MKISKIGEHYLIELLACAPEKLERCETVRPLLLEAARKGNATIISDEFHQFNPYGVTGIILLAESHISIHTWPEHRLAAVDIFTCGDSMNADVVIEVLRNGTSAGEVQIRHIERTKRLPNYEHKIYDK